MEDNIKSHYLLTEEQFENFEKVLNENPLKDNIKLQELLNRPKPWDTKEATNAY